MSRTRSLITINDTTYALLKQLADEHFLSRSAAISVGVHLLAATQVVSEGWRPFRQALVKSLNEWLEEKYTSLDHLRNPKRLLRAIGDVERNYSLTKLAQTRECRMYATESGVLVNCWYTGSRGYRIAEGAAGFDEDIEWYLAAAALADMSGKVTEIDVPNLETPSL
jgi:hypothetical protein